MDQITGRFNDALASNYIIWLDEALFVGDHKAADALKSLITEKSITIEPKNQPVRSIFSCHRFFAATNADHFLRIDRDDRRMVYLPISAAYKGDHNYWASINAALHSPELPALVDSLQRRDIANFNPRIRPQSAALHEQKLNSLVAVPAWWYDLLQGDTWPKEGLFLQSTIAAALPTTFVSTANLIASYEGHASKNGFRDRTINQRNLKKSLELLCPSAIQSRQSGSGSQQRGYQLPPLQCARNEFEGYMAGKIDWNV